MWSDCLPATWTRAWAHWLSSSMTMSGSSSSIVFRTLRLSSWSSTSPGLSLPNDLSNIKLCQECTSLTKTWKRVAQHFPKLKRPFVWILLLILRISKSLWKQSRLMTRTTTFPLLKNLNPITTRPSARLRWQGWTSDPILLLAFCPPFWVFSPQVFLAFLA